MFERLINNENIQAGVAVVMTIGVLGGMFALIKRDLRINGERYAEEERIRKEKCLANPDECLDDNYYFGMFGW